MIPVALASLLNKGLKVFPLAKNSKAPRQQVSWQETATNDAAAISDEHTPGDNYGVVCGYYSPGQYLVVVDIDVVGKPGLATWEEWKTQVNIPETLSVRTARGGYHYYFWCATPVPNYVRGDVGVDTRGVGGYVVAPGSTIGGGTYTIETHGDIAPLPAKILALLSYKDKTTGEVDDWDEIPEGGRNATLTALAGGLRRQGMSPSSINTTLQWWNTHGLVVPPLPHSEIELIARSVGAYTPVPSQEVAISLDQSRTFLDMRHLVLPPPPTWLLKPYIPEGRLVLVDGAEGVGKGLFCALLATTLVKEGRTGLWASGEDDVEHDIQRRLLAADYDRTAEGTVLFFKVSPKIPMETTMIAQLIEDTGATFMILDPGRSFLVPPQGVKASYNDDAAIRPGLEALNLLASETGATIVFVHHWNKSAGVTTQLRAGGTAAFTQVPRHRVSMAFVGSTESGTGALEVTKSNIFSKGHLREFRVISVPEYDTAKFVLGDTSPYATLDEWVSSHQNQSVTIVSEPNRKSISADPCTAYIVGLHKGTMIRDTALSDMFDDISCVPDLCDSGILRDVGDGRYVRE